MPLPNHPSDVASTSEKQRITQEAISWFTRLRAKSVDPAAQQEFERWCRQDVLHQQAFQRVAAMWQSPTLKSAVHEAVAEYGIGVIPRRRAKWRAYAGAAVAACAILGFLTFELDLITRVHSDYYTATGERQTVQLPDESVVILNTQTAIAVAYEDSIRRIQILKGEAFFKVQSNPQRPFIVEHDGILTRAVGTAFVVQAAPNGSEVIVSEGAVQVSETHNAWPAVEIAAGQGIRADRETVGRAHQVDARTAMAWVDGRLVVQTMRLAEVINEIRRYYSGTIVIWNPRLGDIQVTGAYNLSDPAAILSTLSKTLHFRMTNVADRLVVLY